MEFAMVYKVGKLNKLILPLILFFITLESITGALIDKSESSLNNLYENLLQREYAGPISFPDHQVERKAQRSPSLRLRFGRSDPNMLPISMTADKRWFGDVNQKPIRSPSLRLRFGRRSDPLMASSIHENNDFFNDYYNDISSNPIATTYSLLSRYEEKEKRKPSGRLRWGRSSNTDYMNHNIENHLQNSGLNEDAQPNTLGINDEKYPFLSESALMHAGLYQPIPESESIQALLKYLEEYDENLKSNNNNNNNEFEREIRKPAPLRLRWGRSTGGIQKNEQQSKFFQPTTNNQYADEASQNTKQQDNSNNKA